MISTLEKITPGHRVTNPTGTLQVIQHMINWVDDTINKEDLRRSDSYITHLCEVCVFEERGIIE